MGIERSGHGHESLCHKNEVALDSAVQIFADFAGDVRLPFPLAVVNFAGHFSTFARLVALEVTPSAVSDALFLEFSCAESLRLGARLEPYSLDMD